MRNILSLAIIIFGLHNQALAEVFIEINGSYQSKNSSYNSLRINGNFDFDNVNIKNTLIVNGSADGKNLKCKNLESNGSFEVNSFKAENVRVNGSFFGQDVKISKNSEFTGVTEITKAELKYIQGENTYLRFSDSVIKGDIFIKKLSAESENFDNFFFKSNKPSKQVLKLEKGSLVFGNVTFEEEGEIHLSKDSKIKGQITNAKIIKN